MSTLKKMAIAASATSALLAAGVAPAALTDRGGGMIYDTVNNITWLSDMNYAATSGYVSDGFMDLLTANHWAGNLIYGGYSDWRLPTLNPADKSCSFSMDPGGGYPLQYYGFNCTGGELSHLFVVDLGNQEGESVFDQAGDTAEQISNLALFSNVQSFTYLSSVEYAPNSNDVWVFSNIDGFQGLACRGCVMYAVAVRDGDVAAVPEPGTYVLMALGLAGVGLIARRRRNS